MTYMDLINEIKALGFPCTYGNFKTSPPIPFTVVAFSHSNDFMADNQNYQEVGYYQLEYYNDKKYPPDEEKIEGKLKELGLAYNKSEAYIESEELRQIIYEFQIIGG